MQKAPAAVEKPIKETSLPLWVHPQTLESPSVGTSQQQAEQPVKEPVPDGRYPGAEPEFFHAKASVPGTVLFSGPAAEIIQQLQGHLVTLFTEG